MNLFLARIIALLQHFSTPTKKEKASMTDALRKTKQRTESAINIINKWHNQTFGKDDEETGLNELSNVLKTYKDFENGLLPCQTERSNPVLQRNHNFVLT